MKTLNKKLFRDLKGSWKMLIATTAILAVGIGCFIGMLSASRNLHEARSSYFSTSRLADFWIDLKKVPVDEAIQATDLPGISHVRHRLQFQVTLDMPESDRPINALVLSLPTRGPSSGNIINDIVMRTGSGFTSDRANEIIVSEKFAKARDISVGDQIDIIMQGRKKELIVVGTAVCAEFVYVTSPGSLIDEPGTYGLFWAKRDFMEDAFGFEGACNSITGLFAPEAKSSGGQKILNELNRRLSDYGVISAIGQRDQFSTMSLNAEMEQLKTMAYIFPSFFLFVAALVLNVLMGRIAEQQRTILGTFKALGYSSRDLMRNFLFFGLAAGLLGGILGGILGYWLSGLMTDMYQVYFSFPELQNRTYLALLLLGLLFSMLACGFGTIRGVRRAIKLTPAEAMRPAPPAQGGRIALENWRSIWSRLDIRWQMVMRGLFRKKWRSTVSVVSAALGASIVVLAFGFIDSMDAMLKIQFEKTLRSDFHLQLERELDESATEEVRRLPGVTLAESVFSVPCDFTSGHRMKKGGVIGVATDSTLTSPVGEDGRSITVPKTGLLMAERLATHLGVRRGDTVTLTPIRGNRDPIEAHIELTFPSMLGLDVYANDKWLAKLLGEDGAVSEIRVLTKRDPEEQKKFISSISELPLIEGVTDIRNQKAALQSQVDSGLRGMAVVMIIFAGVIFFGSILNSTLIAMSERRREIATFSAMGYHDRETAGLFFRENLLTNITGTLIGIPLGAALLHATVEGFETDVYSIPALLRSQSCLYTIALALLFVLISQLAVFRNLNQLDRVGALNVQE